MANNLADKHPEKLAELKSLFLAEAVIYKMLPLDDCQQELFDPNQTGCPNLVFVRKSLTLSEGMGTLLENDFINVKNTSFEIIAELNTQGSKTNGVVVQQAGRFGGWSSYILDGKPGAGETATLND